ncbi:unnamed protein product [Closterium sp. NIES-64]|nr:unnamed protein product [Closterium sp. NIES-64]
MLLPKPPSKALKGGSGAGLAASGSGSVRGGIGRAAAGAGGRAGGLGAAAVAVNSFLPPQLRGRSNVATEDLDRIFSKTGKQKP